MPPVPVALLPLVVVYGPLEGDAGGGGEAAGAHIGAPDAAADLNKGNTQTLPIFVNDLFGYIFPLFYQMGYKSVCLDF